MSEIDDFEEIGGGKMTYIKFSQYPKTPSEPITVVEGKYIESRPSARYRNQMQHFFYSPKMGDVCVPGSSYLDKMMKMLDPGNRVKIIYRGKELITKGQNQGKDYINLGVYTTKDVARSLKDVEAEMDRGNKGAAIEPEIMDFDDEELPF